MLLFKDFDDFDEDLIPYDNIQRSVVLMDWYYMGDDDAGKKLVGEAIRQYYSGNTFAVRPDTLFEFSHGAWEPGSLGG